MKWYEVLAALAGAAAIFFGGYVLGDSQPTPAPIVHTVIVTTPATPTPTGCAPISERVNPVTGLVMSCP